VIAESLRWHHEEPIHLEDRQRAFKVYERAMDYANKHEDRQREIYQERKATPRTKNPTAAAAAAGGRADSVRAFCREGLPPELRPEVWRELCETVWGVGFDTGLYEGYCRQTPREDIVEAIEKDLHRTFPDNAMMKQVHKQDH